MSELDNLSRSLDRTLKDSDLHNVSVSLAEVFADSLMEDGIAKDIPILSTLVGLRKTAQNITESLFIKKIIYFITELKSIPAQKRNEVVEQIDNSKEYRTKVGEKLIYILDKCDDHEKAQLVARLFVGVLSGQIDYGEFLKAAQIVNQLVTEDLKWFVNNGWEQEYSCNWSNHRSHDFGYINIEDVGSIATTSLFKIVSPDIRVEDQTDWKASDKYVVEGSELSVQITDIGKKMQQILKPCFQ